MVTLIKNGTIVNEGLSYKGSLLINDNIIEKIVIHIPAKIGYATLDNPLFNAFIVSVALVFSPPIFLPLSFWAFALCFFWMS